MMTRSPARIRKGSTFCSALAIATSLVLGPSPAAAQSFEAAIPTGSDITNGGVVTTSPGVTDIALNGGQTVINWTPSDAGPGPGGIGFQYGGTATFHSATDFAVLNRIVPVDPTRLISMDGTIQSLVNGLTGGSVYFYSPAGIVLGPNALINVGSLVLTTSPIAVDGSGQFINGTTVTFGNANPSSHVSTNPGSTINALNSGSYVAMVAPRVDHNGTINVNGAAALVGAEAATINFRAGGLFDIQVDTGTTDANGVIIGSSGVITGPASTGFPDYHRAYLVAVPKNTALTMLISSGSDLGFDIAGAADVVGNAIVLSAGHDISFGDASSAPSTAAGALANINLTNSNFTSALYGRASGEAIVGASAGGSSTFASDVSLRAGNKVRFFSGNPDSSVTVGGNLTLSANANGLNDGDSATAGIVQVDVFNGGSMSVAGSTNLSAIGTGGFSATPGLASGDGTGGTILVQSTTGGSLTLGDAITDTFSADASGHGGSFYSDGGFIDGGSGFGGTVNVFTSAGSSMTVAGNASLTANGQAGQPSDCFQCGGIGGVGDAGTVNVQAHTGPSNTMDFASSLFINANGIGGDGQSGGLGLGGNVIFSATGSSTVTVVGSASIAAGGTGGRAFGPDGDGGDGFGGDVDVAAGSNGSLDIDGILTESVGGGGGDSEGGNGGDGIGGIGELFSNGGTVAVGQYSSIFANGRGGDGLASGGKGQGGSAYFSSSNGGTLTLGTFASLIADGHGGDAFDADGLGGNGGLGDGGHAEAYANGAGLDVQGTLVLSADGFGGDAGGGRDAGDSQGGDVYLQALNGGSLSVAGGLYASAVGVGAYTSSAATNSGDGTGGFIGVYSRDGDSTLTVSGEARLDADGVANAEGECSPCGGVGGIGQGGNIIIASQGAAGVDGNLLDFGGELSATANGYGGNGIGGAAGNGIGGTVSLSAADGNKVTVSGLTTLEATGWGGYDYAGLVGGTGTGGTAQITTVAGNAANSMTLGGANVDASGWGGNSGTFVNGNGGDGTGGTARMYSPAGTIQVTGDVTLEAEGYGGDSDGSTGIGGDGFGKLAELVANGGDITIGGTALVDVSGGGGDGQIGGDGIGGGVSDGQGSGTDGAHIFARNASITIDGSTSLDASGIGGDGGASTQVSGTGGAGGSGSGGWTTIFATNDDLGPSSISLFTVSIAADGTGGSGGMGGSGSLGGIGGTGGNATGGVVTVAAAAGNGALFTDDVFASATANGGTGGTGGSGGVQPGGNGGVGGNAVGGLITVGTISGPDRATASNLGVATYGAISADASAVGGDGGTGNFGNTVNGIGGNGGNAQGGGAVLLVRGSTVSAGNTSLSADATGGNGGFGSAEGSPRTGNGGTASIGGPSTVLIGFDNGIGVVVTDRYLHTDQRGTLNADAITGSSVATGGDGWFSGASQTLGGNAVLFRSADGNLGSIDFTIGADSIGPGAVEDVISVKGGDVTLTGDLSFVTDGTLSLFADTGSMTSSSLILSAADFVPDTINVTPVSAGTYFADSATIFTGHNFITTANLDIGSSLVIDAPGFISAHNFTIDGDLDLFTHGGGITANNLDVAGEAALDAAGSILLNTVQAGFVHIQASDSVASGDINSGSNIQVQSGADMNLGNLTAGVTIDQNSNKAVRLHADGSITVGNVTALGGIDFDATGSVTGLDIISGEVVFASADGAISFGDISGGLINPQPPTDDPFGVGLSSGTSISIGDVAGANGIAFLTLGALTTGDLTSGGDVLGLAGGNMSLGAITAGSSGRTYLADVSMAGGGVGSGDHDGDPEVIFAATPVAGSGSIAIGGPVSTGSFQAAGASISAGNVNANSFIQIISTGNVTLGDLVAGVSPSTEDAVGLESGGSILVGNITSAGGIDFSAVGSVTGLNITTGDELGGGADGAISLGNISAGLVNPQGPVADGFSVELSSGTSISVGSVAGAQGVAFATPGALTTGNITAGTDALAMAGGNMSFGAITATGRTYLADFSMFALSQTGPDFDPAPIFAATPVASTGSITIGGPVSTGSFQAAGASITAGNINADSFIQMISSGSISFNTLVAGTFVTIDPTDIVGGDVTALAGDVDMTGNSIDIGNVSASDNVFLTALAGDLSTGTIDAGFDVTLNASGDVTTSDITAGGLIDATGASLTLGNLSANSISLTTTVADLTVGNVTIPGNLALNTAGDLTFGDLIAFDVDLSATGAIAGGDIDSATDITALAGTNMSLGDLAAGGFFIETFLIGNISLAAGGGITTLTQSAFGDVLMNADGDISASDITGASITAFAGGDIDTGDLTTQQLVQLFSFVPGVSVWLDSGGDITTGDISSFDSAHAQAVGGIATGAIDAQGFVELFAGGNISAGAISAIDYIDVAADGSILVASATSGEDIDFDAGTTVNGGNVTAGDSFTALANGNITLGALSAGIVNPSTAIDAGYSIGLATNGSINTGPINAAADIGLGAAGTITTGNLNADGIVLALGGGGMSFGSIAAGALGQLYIADFSMITLGGTLDNFDPLPILAADPIASAGSITIGGPVSTGWMRAAGAGTTSGDINAVTFIDLLSTGGMTLGNLTAGENIELTSGGAVTLLNATAGEIIDFDGIAGNLTGGNMTAGDSVEGNAQGSIQLGALSAGLVNPSSAVDAEHSVKLAALNGSINVGAVNASADIAMAASGTMTTGNLNADGFVALLADGNMTLGSITTAGSGRVLLADFSMLALGGDVGTDGFDISLVLAAEPVATSGSIAIGGPVSTGLFQATAGQGLSAGAITAQTIDASAGGTAAVNGNWSAQQITLASNDIDITASGFLNAGLAGPLTLISTNSTQALIGDGLSGTGYALSNAEFGRLHGGAVSVLANGAASAAQDMLIGDLSITGPLAGSTIDNPNGIVVFATGDLDTLTPGGVIRVVGDVEATGFQSGNALEFQTGLFELDAATGSISVEGLSNALGGILDITADRIHVASGAILNQLAANPHYTGYQNDLNAPAAVQRPDGVIRASQIFVQPTEAVLVQNTGTADIPAGFIANSAELTAPEGAPAGSIELIVNGQLVTEAGTLTGIAARDAYVADTDLSIYSNNSTINGCLLVGPCGFVPPPEEPPIDPVGGIAAEITLISNDVLSEQPFGNEPIIDDQEGTEDDESSSPIEPPAPLFDTRPLNPDADIDEPISGSGNPALTGAGPVNDGDQQ